MAAPERLAPQHSRRPEDRPGARVPPGGLPRVSGMADDPRDRDHHRSRRGDPSEDARVANGGEHGQHWSVSTISGARMFVDQMLASPLLATVTLATIAVSRPRALPAAAPVLLLWAIAPFVAYRLSQPVGMRRPAVRAKDRRFLRLVARKTWRYFDAFVGAADHGLPPDNFQEVPQPVVAHRTSPTNIGMSCLTTHGGVRARFHRRRRVGRAH